MRVREHQHLNHDENAKYTSQCIMKEMEHLENVHASPIMIDKTSDMSILKEMATLLYINP